MIDFFTEQMDYIYFFYGLAFIMLAAVSFIIARTKTRQHLPWSLLGFFGLLHGFHEWVHIISIDFQDIGIIKQLNTVLMLLSFLFLFEFGRSGIALLRGRNFAGRWIYIPLCMVIAVGGLAGWNGLNIAARYALGLPGGAMASYALFLASGNTEKSGGKWLLFASLCGGLYALTTGLVGPYADFLPASALNSNIFFLTTGVPIELVRGILSSLIAFSLWTYSLLPADEAGTAWRTLRERPIVTPVILLLVIIAAGWIFTNIAGNHAKNEELRAADIYIGALTNHLAAKMKATESKTLDMADDLEIRAALIDIANGNSGRTPLPLRDNLGKSDDYSVSFYILDRQGERVFLAGRDDSLPPGEDRDFRFFPTVIKNDGVLRYIGYFSFDKVRNDWNYCTDAPVRDRDGRIVGGVVARGNLEEIENSFRKRPYSFLIDSSGTIFISSDEKYCLNNLWPLKKGSPGQSSPAEQSGQDIFHSLITQKVSHGQFADMGGERFLLSRRSIEVPGWSLVLLSPIDNIKAYRLFSIFTTFIFFFLTTAFFTLLHLSRESSARISVSERRYRGLVEGSPNCVALFDGAGKCLTMNKAGLDLIGKEDRIVGERFDRLWSFHTGLTPDEIVGKVLDGEKLSFEAESLHPERGRLVWSAVLNPVRDFDEKISHFVGIFVDITERKKAEEELRRHKEHLEELVEMRTSDLSLTNERLQSEIEEREMTEAALRESEDRFRSLFNLASDGIFLMDPTQDGPPVIIDANITACTMHGYDKDELIGKSVTILDDPDSGAKARERKERLLRGEVMTFEVNHVRKDGSVFPLEVSAGVMKIGGRPYILTIERDITQRKRAEQELKLFSEAIEEAMDGVQITDLSGHVLYSNKAVEEIYGYPSSELFGRHVNEMNVDRDYADREIIPAIKETGRWNGELMVVHKNGNQFPIWLSTALVRDGKGAPIAMIGIIRDITDQKRSEEELRRHKEHLLEMVEDRTFELKTAVQLLTEEISFRKEAEAVLKESEAEYRKLSQEFHTLLNAIPDSLLLVSRELKVLWANSGAASQFGLEVSDLTGQFCYSLWHGSSEPCRDCHVIKSFRTGEEEISRRTSLYGQLLDSRAFPIRNENGEVENVIIVVSDITEKARLHAEAMRTEHLASIGELAAGVAHEINNPINGIINYAQILYNMANREGRQFEIAGRIIKEGDRIAGIVRSLLSFARERKEEKSASDVVKILRDTFALTDAQIRKEGIDLRLDIPAHLPDIIANPQQIQQVFLNIVNNARYALNQKYPGPHPDKRLVISCEELSLNGEHYTRIVFHDSGIGVPADLMDKVFNPFFTSKPSGQGTGLGLSISHGIIKDHGGRIDLESVQGQFSRITIDLPAGKNGE
jgi:two-component system NtrC family sensor kinase